MVSTGVNFNRLQVISPALAGFNFKVHGKIGYSGLPNYNNDTLNKGLSLLNDLSSDPEEKFEEVPKSSESYYNYEAGSALTYALLMEKLPLIFALSYRFSQDLYEEKPIQTNVNSEYDTNQNEVISRSTAAFSTRTGLGSKGPNRGYWFDLLWVWRCC